MNIETFNTPEEMAEALRERRISAHEGLHVSQRRVTFGDCWVRFLDVDTADVEWGRVALLTEVAETERAAGGPDVDTNEIIQTLNATEDNLRGGMLYGIAHSRSNPTGDWGHTHKAHVWPIEARLFFMASEVGFDANRLPLAGKTLLNIAWSNFRTHMIRSSR